jgi:hypothetical protein
MKDSWVSATSKEGTVPSTPGAEMGRSVKHARAEGREYPYARAVRLSAHSLP